SDGAGSVEQTVTPTSLCKARLLKARAAVVVVLPTPPLPIVNPSRVSVTGQHCFTSFNLLVPGCGAAASSLLLRPAKTASPNLDSNAVPSSGFPGSGPMNLVTRGNRRLRYSSAFLLWVARR